MRVIAEGGAHVLCPGGMMTCSSAEVMRAAGYIKGSVHTDPVVMSRVASGIADAADLDNVGVPFCMTVEAEAMGGIIDLGDVDVEPSVCAYAVRTVGEVCDLPAPEPSMSARMPVVLEALGLLRDAEDGHRLVVGNVTGPVSLLTSLVEPGCVYRAMRTDPGTVHAALEHVTGVVERFARAQVNAGAGVVVIAEPSGTGDILGPTWFAEFAAPRLNVVSRAVLGSGAESIVHICGDVRPILGHVSAIPMTAFSFESCMDVADIRQIWPEGRFMGNVSTHLLARSTPERVRDVVAGLVARGIDIVAPACGVPVSAPIANLRAMREGVSTAKASR